MIHFFLCLFFLFFSSTTILDARNVRRPQDPCVPIIYVSATDPAFEKSWSYLKNDPTFSQKCSLRSSFLRRRVFERFDKKFFYENYLPMGPLQFRKKTGSVETSVISHLAEKFVEEIKTGKKEFTDVVILKDRDFNYKSLAGLIIVKFKEYPFVLKLSIEHPHTMVQPYSKSFESTGQFIIGGNLRHLSNFTRITNLKRIKEILKNKPIYRNKIFFPRKWYWKPNKCHDLKIVWKCNDQQEEIFIPSIYAVISDFIQTDKIQPQQELNKLAMRVAIDTGFLIDPHAGNFVIEQQPRQCVLLDTEDFRIMVGLNQSMKAENYANWYLELMSNALQTYCCRSRQERINQCSLM